MDAGRFDRLITIKRSVAVDDGYTTTPAEPTTYCERRASYKAANGREAFENLGREAKPGGSFWIRSDSVTRGILTTDVLAFSGRDYDILSLNEMGRRDYIEIVAVARDVA